MSAGTAPVIPMGSGARKSRSWHVSLPSPDAFESMTRRRRHCDELLAASEAIAQIRDQSGTQFDPHLVSLFVEVRNEGLVHEEVYNPQRELAMGDEERRGMGSTDEHSQLDGHLRRITRELRAAGLVPRLERLPDVAVFPRLALLRFREWEVLVYCWRGERVASIATQLFISPSTVRSHISSIFAKLGMHSQADLIHRLRSD